MRIHVTQRDMDIATPGANTCPIAQACRRQGVDVLVGPNTIQKLYLGRHRGLTHGLPLEARDFIELWDAKKPGLDPFTFEVPGMEA